MFEMHSGSPLLRKFDQQEGSLFRDFIWEFYAKYGRKFVWRNIDCPYKVFVSEVMLQQTQTSRVETKYGQFINQFPTIEHLAQADLRSVLSVWQGLGYNRRGKFLHQAAQQIMQDFKQKIPADPLLLQTLPGIGKATAASILAFAYNTPTVFIETNIRAVFLFCFFHGKKAVTDSQLLPLVESTLDLNNAREWYYALMDYGVYLKKTVKNPSHASKHYTQQSKFEGSDRQIRGMIIRLLTQWPHLAQDEICAQIDRDADRVIRILSQLCSEQLISLHQNYYSIR